MSLIVLTADSCVISTPLGSPVVPDVKITYALLLIFPWTILSILFNVNASSAYIFLTSSISVECIEDNSTKILALTFLQIFFFLSKGQSISMGI